MDKILFRKSGMTLLEVLLATFIFSILCSLVFYIFMVSAGAWLKARQTFEVRESAQIVITRMEKELRASNIKSVDVKSYPSSSGNDAISFISGIKPTGGSDFSPAYGTMTWQKFVIFYLEDDNFYAKDGYYQLFSREVIYDDNFLERYEAMQLKDLPYPPEKDTPDDDTHKYNMLDYLTGLVPVIDPYFAPPRAITRNIETLKFFYDPDFSQKVEIYVTTGKPVNPKDPSSAPSQERLKLKSLVVLRNKT